MPQLLLLRFHTIAATCIVSTLVFGVLISPVRAHESENTHVLITFMLDEEYQVDVLNDADWMWLQFFPAAATLPTIEERNRQLTGLVSRFTDSITVAFDGVASPVDTITYVPPIENDRTAPMGLTEPGLIRLTGTVPDGARTFQFAYALVIDRFPLTISPPTGASVTRWLMSGELSEEFEIQMLQPMTRLQVSQQYLQLGFTHILPRGLDHILFIIGLFLLSTKFKPLLLQVTAFTIAHTITLALTIYGVFSLAPSVVEPLIALSIAYVAVENLVTTELKSWRVALVFAFGLLHGMGFADILTNLGLPRAELLTALLTFNLGVETGQLAVIGMASVAVLGCRNRSWYRQRVVIPFSLAIACVGLFWTVERVLTV